MAPRVSPNNLSRSILIKADATRLPLGVPHRVAQDDWYEGMLIPKDATVIIPSYAIHRSEKWNYKDPNTFNPARYLQHPRLANDYAGSPDYNNRDKVPTVEKIKMNMALTFVVDYITMAMEQAAVFVQECTWPSELNGGR